MSPWLFLSCVCLLPLATGLLGVGPITREIIKRIKDVWELMDVVPVNKQVIEEEVQRILGQLSAVEGKLLAPRDMILQKIDNLPSDVKKSLQLDKLFQAIRSIQEVEFPLEDNDVGGDHISDINIKKIIDKARRYNLKRNTEGSLESIQDGLKNIHNRSHIFSEILVYLKKSDDNMCEFKMSLTQLFSYIFSIMQIVQIKGYTTLQLSWLMLHLYKEGKWANHAEIFRRYYIDRMSQQAVVFMQSMKKHLDSRFWRCDPKSHVEGETYTEVTKLMQGILINEIDLNKKISCSKGCSAYESTKQYGCKNYTFCSKQCNGDVVDCQSIDYEMNVCEAPANSNRRYDWIMSKYSGLRQSCHEPTTTVNSLWSRIFERCLYCYCLCENPNDDESVRYFNLRPVLSDKDNNRVVTGIRFIKVNRIIHLQIQQGELLPYGGINKMSIDWKPVDDYSVDDKGVKEGVDYYTLTRKNRRMNLDMEEGMDGYILIGVAFVVVGNNLDITGWTMKYSFTEGKLIHSYLSFSQSDVNMKRTQLSFSMPDVPTKAAEASRIDSESGQFVEFGPTDLVLDAGQSTIPFLDTQDVAPEPATPLAGIGLYHKGGRESGGFVAPMVLTSDFYYKIVENIVNIP